MSLLNNMSSIRGQTCLADAAGPAPHTVGQAGPHPPCVDPVVPKNQPQPISLVWGPLDKHTSLDAPGGGRGRLTLSAPPAPKAAQLLLRQTLLAHSGPPGEARVCGEHRASPPGWTLLPKRPISPLPIQGAVSRATQLRGRKSLGEGRIGLSGGAKGRGTL